MKNTLIIILLILISSTALFGFEKSGLASWYGPDFQGKLTANGERFNTWAMTAAHKTLPFGSIVRVTSLENDRSVVVRINDRGPFVAGRIIDLSKAAALKLDLVKHGTMKVRLVLLENGDNRYHRFSRKQYTIQVASFSNKERADEMAERLKQAGVDVDVKSAWVKKKVWRLVIEDLNYSEVQIYRVKLHNAGISSYLIKTN